MNYECPDGYICKIQSYPAFYDLVTIAMVLILLVAFLAAACLWLRKHP